MVMEHINDLLFLALNAGPRPPRFVLGVALFLANWLAPLAILLFVGLWIRKPARDRSALITATLTMLLGLVVNQALGLLYFHPRPFMAGIGRQYLAHAADNSFPSDHATFLWSLGFSLLALGALRGWAALLLIAGVAIAWARIYVGVHFPFDMLGSLFVALAVTPLSKAINSPVERWLTPFCVRLYEDAIRLCRLPRLLFPRKSDEKQCDLDLTIGETD